MEELEERTIQFFENSGEAQFYVSNDQNTFQYGGDSLS